MDIEFFEVTLLTDVRRGIPSSSVEIPWERVTAKAQVSAVNVKVLYKFKE